MNQIILALILIAAALPISRQQNKPNTSEPLSSQILDVQLCDLASQPEKYNGKLIRLRASLLSSLCGHFVYDMACEKAEIGFILDSDFDDQDMLASLRKTFDESINYKRVQGRTEAILIGRFVVVSVKPKLNEYKYTLHIKHIDELKKIAPDTAWPDSKDCNNKQS